MTIIGSLEKF